MVPGGPATRGPVIGHGGEILHKLRAEAALDRDPQRPRGRVGELHVTPFRAQQPQGELQHLIKQRLKGRGGTRIPQRLMKHLGRLRPRALHTVDKPRRQDPDRNVELLRRPPQQIKGLIRATTPLGHQDALRLLDHRHGVQLGRTERHRSGLHRVHYGTPKGSQSPLWESPHRRSRPNPACSTTGRHAKFAVRRADTSRLRRRLTATLTRQGPGRTRPSDAGCGGRSAARAAYGGNAARAASAREHRAGLTTRPARQTPAGGQAQARLGARARKSEREPGTPKASGWFDNRTPKDSPERSDGPDPEWGIGAVTYLTGRRARWLLPPPAAVNRQPPVCV